PPRREPGPAANPLARAPPDPESACARATNTAVSPRSIPAPARTPTAEPRQSGGGEGNSGSRCTPAHTRYQPIPAAAQRLDPVAVAVAIQLAPQIRNVRLNHVGVMLPVVIVKVFQQNLLRNHRPWPVTEVFERAIFRRRKLHRLAGHRHRLLQRVDHHIRHFNFRIAYALAAPDERLRPRQQLAQIERL